MLGILSVSNKMMADGYALIKELTIKNGGEINPFKNPNDIMNNCYGRIRYNKLLDHLEIEHLNGGKPYWNILYGMTEIMEVLKRLSGFVTSSQDEDYGCGTAYIEDYLMDYYRIKKGGKQIHE